MDIEWETIFIWDTCWNLWKQWNIVIFYNGSHCTEDIATSVETSLQEDKKRHMRVVRQIGWEAPQKGRIKIDTEVLWVVAKWVWRI